MAREAFTGYKPRPPAGAWAEDAACKGKPASWWYEDGTELARQTCQACPVRESCLQHALDTDEPLGMWGGLLPSERRRILLGDTEQREHGTVTGWNQHYRRGEPQCPFCREAKNANKRERMAREAESKAASLRAALGRTA